MMQQIAIVTPVLDDWESLVALIGEISAQYSGAGITFHVFAVDDGSNEPFDVESIKLPANTCIDTVELLRLSANLGHQRAIAIGLCTVAHRDDFDAVVVMDSDGEDRPEDIATLLAASRSNPGHVIMARRAKRSERLLFKMGYCAYKWLFHLLTGRTINFGNFSLLPMPAVERLVHVPDLWNNMAATIMRSRLRYTSVPTERGIRYAGGSRMNFVSLIVHGLSAMSVYTDMIFVRVLVAACGIIGLSVLSIVGVAVLRLATDLAIPGWASVVAGDLMIIMLQTLVVLVASSLAMLAGRSSRPIIPVADSEHFVALREQWKCRRPVLSAVPARAAQ
jgi:polyisoprenyl-phosphate glycosyltransferase